MFTNLILCTFRGLSLFAVCHLAPLLSFELGAGEIISSSSPDKIFAGEILPRFECVLDSEEAMPEALSSSFFSEA
jgi:hypothetical protein